MMNFILKQFGLDPKYIEIHEGYSYDKKYKVFKQNQQFLLRQIDSKNRDQTRNQIDVAYMCERHALPVQKLAGVYHTEDYDYLLFHWIEGQNLYDELSKMEESQQYKLGVKAGQIHHAIHDIPCKQTLDWITYFNKKIDRKINMYLNAPMHYENDEILLNAIERDRKYLSNHRISYLHGDFHALNMVLGKNKELSVIDLNRAEIGDPYEEFLRITWDVERSIPFARGRLDGYFKDEIPLEFWQLLRLYICTDLLTLLYWSVTVSPEQVQIALNKYKLFAEYYDAFQLDVPKWY